MLILRFRPMTGLPVRFLEQNKLAYVAAKCRAREIHKLWHIPYNLPISVPGEVTLKMLESQYCSICLLVV